MSEEIAVAEWEETSAPVAPVTLFGTNDPGKVIAAATEAAKPLAEVVRKQGLATNIQGREHVKVEGWTLLGSMLGVFPVTVWTHKMLDPDGWEARVEARTRDGAVVGAAEAQCTRAENQWSLTPKGRNGQTLTARDDYALRSMAQTRATSKALRQPLGFVMQLAGFDATPAEEMPTEAHSAQAPADTQGLQQSRGDTVLPGQVLVPFGKHKNKKVSDVPRDYWDWWLGEDGAKNPEVLAAVQAHLGLDFTEQGDDLESDLPF